MLESEAGLSPGPSIQHRSVATAQETTCGEQGHVRSVGQLFIRDVELNATGNLLANTIGQIDEDLGEPLSSGVASQSHVGGNIISEIVRGD